MKYIWECRRTGIAFLGMVILSIPLLMGKADTSTAIASIAIGLGAANAYQKKGTDQGPGLINDKQE